MASILPTHTKMKKIKNPKPLTHDIFETSYQLYDYLIHVVESREKLQRPTYLVYLLYLDRTI